jgi:hypothetical protein
MEWMYVALEADMDLGGYGRGATVWMFPTKVYGGKQNTNGIRWRVGPGERWLGQEGSAFMNGWMCFCRNGFIVVSSFVIKGKFCASFSSFPIPAPCLPFPSPLRLSPELVPVQIQRSSQRAWIHPGWGACDSRCHACGHNVTWSQKKNLRMSLVNWEVYRSFI